MRRQSEAVEQHLRQMGIVCFATLMGTVLFGGVVWYLVNQAGFAPSQEFPSYLALGASPSLCPSGYDGSPHLRRGSLVF